MPRKDKTIKTESRLVVPRDGRGSRDEELSVNAHEGPYGDTKKCSKPCLEQSWLNSFTKNFWNSTLEKGELSDMLQI